MSAKLDGTMLRLYSAVEKEVVQPTLGGQLIEMAAGAGIMRLAAEGSDLGFAIGFAIFLHGLSAPLWAQPRNTNQQ